MKKSSLPGIRLDNQKPAGLKFKTSDNALSLWDKALDKTAIQAAAAPQSYEINILSEIGDEDWGGFSAATMKRSLAAAGKAPLLVLLNSPGGDAFEGVAIYNLLRAHAGNVTVRVLGLAASAASVIAMAGDRIEIGEAAFLMIHSAWGIVAGNRNDMREFANTLDALDTGIAELYASRSGLPTAEVLSLMEAETWMSGADAVKLGFADIALAEKKPAAKNLGKKEFLQQHHPLASASGSHARPMVRMSLNKPATSPGASGKNPSNPKETKMKTIAEQIAAFEAKRMASATRMTDIMNKAAESERSLDEAEEQEYDTLNSEVTATDQHLVRLRALEKTQLATATVIHNNLEDPAAAAAARAGTSTGRILSLGPNVEKGVKFARYAMAQYRANGDSQKALAIVQNEKRWMDQTPEVAKVLMAAVAAGDTTTSGWASELVYNENLAAEFIEFLRPMTVVGKLTTLRRVPFNVRMGSQTAAGSANWVGQGLPIAVSKLGVSAQTLGITKIAALLALDDELMRSSSPSAELLVRDDLAKTTGTFMDVQFLDPNVAAVSGVNPASMTNGVTAVAATGVTAAAFRTDMATLMKSWAQSDLDSSKGVWIMTPNQALNIGLMLNSLGLPLYDGINITGGTLLGLPVITSNSANIPGSPDSGNMIILINPPEVFLADDGQITIDVSNQASIQMLDNPTNASTGATVATSMVSMFQTASTALRGIRYINWSKRRSNAVVYIREAAYAA